MLMVYYFIDNDKEHILRLSLTDPFYFFNKTY